MQQGKQAWRLEATAELWSCGLVGIAAPEADGLHNRAAATDGYRWPRWAGKEFRLSRRRKLNCPELRVQQGACNYTGSKGKIKETEGHCSPGQGVMENTGGDVQCCPCPWLPWPGLSSGDESLCRTWRRAALPTAVGVCYSTHQFSGCA